MSLLQNSNAISADGAYNITDSLRFRRSANAYLSRTPASTGNRKTFTFSLWFKGKGYYTGNDHLIGVNTSSTSYARVYYGASGDNYLRVNQYVGGVNLDLRTTQVLRDPSAWYHLVVAFDTTQATASNRIKMYLNGEQITSFATATYPSQNFDTLFNTTNEHRIGTLGANFNVGYEFDGYMTEVNFVDGQALTPSDFGETNDDGVWSPKKYTGTYGTNGFYLPMKETTQATGFNTVLYTGKRPSQSITGVGFSPDLVWLKSRDLNALHAVFDTVRGANQRLRTNDTVAEDTSVVLPSFDADGFTLGDDYSSNNTGNSFVAWCWDAGSSTVSNTDGTITSTVRANPASGFSVVTYTGTGSSGTVGHGLGSTPDMIIVKRRNAVDSWFCYHSALTTDNYMLLNGTNAVQSLSGYWGTPSSTTFGAVYGGTNTSGGTYVAYCFSEVAGYSKFGSYTGNGSTSGPTVTTGFKPAFVMLKRTDSTSSWIIFDNTRDVGDFVSTALNPDVSNSEFVGTSANAAITFTDNGFQLVGTGGAANASGGTYIYMAFADTRDYQWNFDASGNKNNWTPNNINSNASSETTYDLMSDTPSLANEDTGNFATLNPNVGATGVTNVTLSEANLKYENSDATYRRYIPSTISIAPSSGKFYCEGVYTVSSQATYDCFGIADATLLGDGNRGASNVVGIWSYRRNGNADIENTGGATGVSYGDSWAVGDVIGIAYDSDTGSLTFYKNGVSQGQLVTGIDITVCFFVAGFSNCDAYMNFGQRPFAYTPPTGYKKLNTFNLPDSSMTDGSQYMNSVLWTGDGSTTRNITGFGFTPDLIWTKKRSATGNNYLFDSIRGDNKVLISDLTNAELTPSSFTGGGPNGIIEDGFDIVSGTSNADNINANGVTFVGWGWRGSDSTAVSNTDGTITSTVSANPTSGFSVVTFTGTGATGTVGHGLSQAPEVYIRKSRSNSENWFVYTTIIDGSLDYLILNSTSAKANSGASLPNATTFEVGAGESSGEQLVTYCFHSVEGFSKMGTYTGNGSTNGPFVYTGFRPAVVMFKNANAARNWGIIDTARSTYNQTDHTLEPNTSNAENPYDDMDILSNGFKMRTTDPGGNASGQTIIYMAFAENPFKNSLAR